MAAEHLWRLHHPQLLYPSFHPSELTNDCAASVGLHDTPARLPRIWGLESALAALACTCIGYPRHACHHPLPPPSYHPRRTHLMTCHLGLTHGPTHICVRPNVALQVAVIVNDMTAVNVDTKLVKDRSLSRTQEQVVELSNGCICCTLRDDLLQVGQGGV